eukprot:1195336-Prorocentrum_minimum.AAC.5
MTSVPRGAGSPPHGGKTQNSLEVDVHIHVDFTLLDFLVVVVLVLLIVVVRVAIHQIGARVDVAQHAAVQPACQRALVAC